MGSPLDELQDEGEGAISIVINTRQTIQNRSCLCLRPLARVTIVEMDCGPARSRRDQRRACTRRKKACTRSCYEPLAVRKALGNIPCSQPEAKKKTSLEERQKNLVQEGFEPSTFALLVVEVTQLISTTR